MISTPEISLPALYAVQECAVDMVAWQLPAGPRLTVVAKIAFTLLNGEIEDLLPAVAEIEERERHHDDSLARSLEAAGDLAPLMPGAEVIVVGHAYAAPGRASPSLTAQIQIARKSQILMKKRLLVLGDRAAPDARPAPFQRMPLVWERALRTEANPVGLATSPNLVDMDDPARASSFGPIASTWSERRALLKDVPRSVLESEPMLLPAGFDFRFFHAAPADQRLASLAGAEWVALDGLHPALPRIQFKLPAVTIAVRLVDPNGRPAKVTPLIADRLLIDTDRQVGTLTYRGALTANWTELGQHRVEVGLSKADGTISFPSLRDPRSLRARKRHGMVAGTSKPPETSQRTVNTPDPALPFPPASARGEERAEPAKSIQELQAPAPVIRVETRLASFGLPDVTVDDSLDRSQALMPAIPFAGALEPGQRGGPSSSEGLPFVSPEAFAQMEDPPSISTTEALDDQLERTKPLVPITNPPELSVATIPWQIRPPVPSLTIAAKATFELVQGEAARLLPDPELLVGDVHREEDRDLGLLVASDFAVFKPKADVTVVGHAHAPNGEATSMQVHFHFGGGTNKFQRALAVRGDRVWRKALVTTTPSDPQSFQKIPIGWETAFGGAAFAENPLGLGHHDGKLPNVEERAKLIEGPDDTPAPASFAPVPVRFPVRWKKLGTYDDAWLETRWPYFPADFDWTYFQAAPKEQQLAWLRGDEAFEIGGMHDEHPLVRGTLPGIRVRAFVQKTRDAGGLLTEVALRLDTAAFDLDAGRLNLVWRGFVEVSEESAPEIATIFTFHESLAEPPATLEEVRAKLVAALTRKRPIEESPEAPTAPANDAAPVDAPIDPEMERFEAEHAAREEALKETFRAAGIDVEKITAEPPPKPDPEAMAASLRASGVDDAQIAEILESLKPPPPPAEPKDDAASTPVDLRARVILMLNANASLEGLDAQGADLSKLDFSKRSLRGANLKDANFSDATLTGADLSGAQLGAANFALARLDGANLTGADLTGARLECASLALAIVERASFEEAKGNEANFHGATGRGASFAKGDFTAANFSEAEMPKADFTSAILERANFEAATIPDITLFSAQCREARFDLAKMANARADEVVMHRASLRRVEAPASIWENADLSKASFVGASMARAGLVRSECRATNFGGADLKQARFAGARAAEAQFLKANLMEATFEKADLSRADLRGANLYGAETWKALLKGAQLDQANVKKTKLEKGKRK